MGFVNGMYRYIFSDTVHICVLGYKRDLCSNWVKFIQIQFIYAYDKKQIEMPTQITISSNRPTIFFLFNAIMVLYGMS